MRAELEAIFEVGDDVYHVGTGFEYIGYINKIEDRNGHFWYRVLWEGTGIPVTMNRWWHEGELDFAS